MCILKQRVQSASAAALVVLSPEGVAGTPWFFVNDIDVGVNPNDEVGYESWVRLINALLRFREYRRHSHA